MRSKTSYPPEFEAFWAEHPRPVGKPAAYRAWLATEEDRPDLETLIAAIRHQWVALGWADKDVCFIPHPATWLNQHRWEDNGQKRKPPSLLAQQQLVDERRRAAQEAAADNRLQELRGMAARKARVAGAPVLAVVPPRQPVADLLSTLTTDIRRKTA